MSLRGNNAHWLTPRVIRHQGFNTSYHRIYFQPDGTILKCYHWDREEMEVNDEIKAAVESALTAKILGLDCNTKGEFEYLTGSPYLIIGALIKDDITLLKKAYFSEHSTDSKGVDKEVCEMFPIRHEDSVFLERLIKKKFEYDEKRTAGETE